MVSGGTVCAELKERGGHQVPSLLGGPHHGDEQRFDVEIEQSLDQLDVARNGPNHRMYGISGYGLQLSQDGSDVVRRMLSIDHQPIEARARADLGAGRIGEAKPQTDLRASTTL